MKEIDLEKSNHTTAQARYHQKTKALISVGAEAHTRTGKLAVSHAINNLVIGIEEYLAETRAGEGKKFKEYFRKLPIELTAVVIARSVINSISQEKKRAAMAVRVGRALEREVALQTFKKVKADQFRKLEIEHGAVRGESMKARKILVDARVRYGLNYANWGVKACGGVGLTAIQIMAKYTGMIESFTKTEFGKRVGYVSATESMIEWLDKAHERHAVSESLYRPMISPPNKWRSNYDGGYYLDQYQDKQLIDDKGKHYQTLKDSDCPALFSAVNHLQECPWSINNEVLDVMNEMWRSGMAVGGMPNPNIKPEPEWLDLYNDSADAMRAYRVDLYMTRTANSRNVGKRYKLQSLLEIAESYKDKVLYFPHSLDFRTRCYPIPRILHPQGDDKAKGLLQFCEAKPIETKEQEDWFFIHGANCWGEDKVSFDDRIKWVNDNEGFIRECADRPLDCIRWAEAEKPFQFLAWCLEFRKYRAHGKRFKSRIPIAQDGSNNGLQLMSLLLKDEKLAKQTNVLPSVTPQDIYQLVADKVIGKLQKDPTTEHLNLLRYGIDRKLLKKAVMVVPYGGSYTTLLGILQDEIYSRSLVEGTLPFKNLRKHCAKLTTVLWQVIQEELPTALALMTWLRHTIRPVVAENIEPSWSSPSNLKVYQGYRNTRRERVITALGYKVRRACNVMIDLDTLSVAKNSRSISPNFCHSLDASVMLTTVERMKLCGVNSLSMIHDSFATHAADSPLLARQLRESVIQIFSDNLLEKFQQDIKSLMPNAEYPDLPPLGSLDINLLTRSRYFFS